MGLYTPLGSMQLLNQGAPDSIGCACHDLDGISLAPALD